MTDINPEQLYKKIKDNRYKYVEEIHCPMIIDVMNNEGTMTAFCRKALISDALFYKWIKKYKVFAECYAIGKIISRANWEQEGEEGKNDEFFNFDHWRITGAMRYGVGKNRVRMGVDSDATPYDQYKQLIEMANNEEFNASEIKQLMEALNVGRSVYETFEMQKQIDEMNKNIERMELNNANNRVTIEKA